MPTTRSTTSRPSNSYTKTIKDEYRELFGDMIFRSHRAAKMMYEDASIAENKYLWIIHIAAFLLALVMAYYQFYYGAAFFTTVKIFCQIASSFFNWQNPLSSYILKQSIAYVQAASGWQSLEKQAYVCLISLNDPNIDMTILQERYLQLVEKREKITASVIVSNKTYDTTDDKSTISRYKDRKESCQKFMREMNL